MQTVATDQGPSVKVGLVPVSKIAFHPHNTRTDLGDLRALSLSIALYGVMQPVVIEKYGTQYRLRAGPGGRSRRRPSRTRCTQPTTPR